MDESVAHTVMYLNIWCPADSTIQGDLGGVAWWEEVCHWGGPGEFKDSPFPVFSLYSILDIQDVISQLPAPAYLPAYHLLESQAQMNSSSVSCPGHWVLSQQLKGD